MGNEDLAYLGIISRTSSVVIYKMVRRKEECAERINLEKERVDYDRR
nr:MAG TPA: hypothetical protein [Caudoviricetes sp.]